MPSSASALLAEFFASLRPRLAEEAVNDHEPEAAVPGPSSALAAPRSLLEFLDAEDPEARDNLLAFFKILSEWSHAAAEGRRKGSVCLSVSGATSGSSRPDRHQGRSTQ
jgi:hypothetical protein